MVHSLSLAAAVALSSSSEQRARKTCSSCSFSNLRIRSLSSTITMVLFAVSKLAWALRLACSAALSSSLARVFACAAASSTCCKWASMMLCFAASSFSDSNLCVRSLFLAITMALFAAFKSSWAVKLACSAACLAVRSTCSYLLNPFFSCCTYTVRAASVFFSSAEAFLSPTWSVLPSLMKACTSIFSFLASSELVEGCRDDVCLSCW
mmetsp:Transcript_30980/g.53651  ORF Transcript_30980/g.53651 Transcript_30980/m.53651 type:complete len:208 (+) Transcript_30980:210-833(+)